MENNYKKPSFNHSTTFLIVAVLIWAFALGMVVGHYIIPKETEIAVPSPLDTSSLEDWCGDFSDGNIRMIGAWRYSDGVVEDEQGQLWKVYETVSEEDFLLIWIADNNTPDDITDDIVIKIWKEVY